MDLLFLNFSLTVLKTKLLNYLFFQFNASVLDIKCHVTIWWKLIWLNLGYWSSRFIFTCWSRICMFVESAMNTARLLQNLVFCVTEDYCKVREPFIASGRKQIEHFYKRFQHYIFYSLNIARQCTCKYCFS